MWQYEAWVNLIFSDWVVPGHYIINGTEESSKLNEVVHVLWFTKCIVLFISGIYWYKKYNTTKEAGTCQPP